MIPPELESLLGKAFLRAHGREANDAIEVARREGAGARGPAVSYEVVLPAAEAAAYLTEKVLPRFVYFLDSRGLPIAEPSGVVISLFLGEALFFVHAGDFVDWLSAKSGVSFADMQHRWGLPEK